MLVECSEHLTAHKVLHDTAEERAFSCLACLAVCKRQPSGGGGYTRLNLFAVASICNKFPCLLRFPAGTVTYFVMAGFFAVVNVHLSGRSGQNALGRLVLAGLLVWSKVWMFTLLTWICWCILACSNHQAALLQVRRMGAIGCNL